MSEYMVRIGTERRTNFKNVVYDELVDSPTKYVEDDGLLVKLGKEPWPEAECPDCHKCNVLWAEACYVPGHRICPCCGSHFSISCQDEEWILRRARFY